MRTPQPDLSGPVPDPPASLPVLPLLPVFPRQRPGGPLPDSFAVHRIPLPPTAPPYDDQDGDGRAGDGREPEPRDGRAAAPWLPGAQPGALDRGGPARGGPAQGGSAQSEPAQSGRAQSGPAPGGPAPGGPARGRPAEAGPPWPSQFAQVLAETLAGSRAPQQITSWTTEQARRRIQQLGPALRAQQRPLVRRVLVCEPQPGVVEMTVIVTVGDRVRALAVRLERVRPGRERPGRNPGRRQEWLCTAVEAA